MSRDTTDSLFCAPDLCASNSRRKNVRRRRREFDETARRWGETVSIVVVVVSLVFLIFRAIDLVCSVARRFRKKKKKKEKRHRNRPHDKITTTTLSLSGVVKIV